MAIILTFKKPEGVDVLKDGYRVFTHDEAIYCLSINPEINQSMSENSKWRHLNTINDFMIFGDDKALLEYEKEGFPQSIKKFLSITKH